MIIAHFNRRSVVHRMVVFQGIPLITICYWIFAFNNSGQVKSFKLLVASTVGITMLYAAMMVMMIGILSDPVFAALNGSRLRIRKTFGAAELEIPSGTTISVENSSLVLRPSIKGVPNGRVHKDRTELKLPASMIICVKHLTYPQGKAS